MPGAPPIQANTSGGSGGSTTNTQNFTVHVTAGNFLVLLIFNATDLTTTITNIAWVGGNSGTLTPTPLSPINGTTRRMWCYTAQITASTGTGVTVTFSASINSIVIFAEYAGVAASGLIIEGEIGTNGTGTAIASGSFTPADPNVLLIGGIFVTSSGGGTLTPGAGFALEVNNASTSHRGLEDRNVSVVASYAATATYSSAQTWIAYLLGLRLASAVVATPTVDNPAGTYPGSVTVTVSNATPGATMCYRTDGTDPAATTPGTCDAGSTTYTAPIVLTTSKTLKVLGTEAAFTNSSILVQAYVVRSAATWYVASAGSDSNTGADAAHPWAHAPGMNGATGVAASTVLVPGDTVLLNRGDSWLNTTLTVPVGGTPGAQITLSAYGSGAKPIISGAVNTPAITTTAGNGYWTIDSIDVRSSGTTPGINTLASIYHNYWAADLLAVPGWVIQNCASNACFYLSGPNTVVRSNTLDGGGTIPLGGIVIRGQVNTNALVERNVVSNFKDRGIWCMNGCTSPVVRYNTVHDIIAGTDNQGMGINLDGANIPVTGAQTYENLVYSCAGIGITHENSQGSKAFRNLVHDCVIGGIDVINYAPYQVQPTNLEISYNVIYNVNIGIPIWDAQALTIIGNTIYGGTGASSQGFGIQSLDTNVSGINFQNNIVAGSFTHPIQVRTAKAVWSAFDYNDIVPSGSEVVFHASDSTSYTLAQLQASGLMAHGITADPKLKTPPTDLSLAAGSPAIGSGVNLGAGYQAALSPASAWPAGVATAPQAATWNMGAYASATSGVATVPRYQALALTAGVPQQIPGTGAPGGVYWLAILNTGPGNLYLSTGATPGANATSMLIPAGKYAPSPISTAAPVWLASDQNGGVSIMTMPRGS